MVVRPLNGREVVILLQEPTEEEDQTMNPTPLIRPNLLTLLVALLAFPGIQMLAAETTRPNILFIFSDDHAQHAISAYWS
jgi:hypothetical protein